MSGEEQDRGTTSIDRALELLDLFTSEGPTLGLTELARMSGWPKATVHRAVVALTRHGLLEQARDGRRHRYQLGLRFLHLSLHVQRRLDLSAVAMPHLVKLRDQTEDSVHLVVRRGMHGIYLCVVDALHPIRLYIKENQPAPLYAGASTRLLLSFLPPEDRDMLLAANPPRSYTPATITNLEELRWQLMQDRIRGYAISYGELAEHSAALATPVLDHSGSVVATVSVAGRAERYRAEGEVNWRLVGLMECTYQISLALGFRGPWPWEPQIG